MGKCFRTDRTRKKEKKQKKESFSRGKIMGKTQTIDTAKRIYFLANFFLIKWRKSLDNKGLFGIVICLVKTIVRAKIF